MKLATWLVLVSFLPTLLSLCVVAASQPPGGASMNPKTKLNLANVYRHSSGFTFRYPASWNLREQMLGDTGAAVMTPDDVTVRPSGPAEAYLVMGSPADGVTRPDDSRVETKIAEGLAQLAPFLRKTGKTAAVPAGKLPGALTTWEGNNFDGIPVRAQIFTTIIEGQGVSLVAIGETKLVERRDEMLRAIFNSFAFSPTEGGGTPASAAKETSATPAGLAGVWMNYEYKAVGSSSWEKKTYASLGQDGRFLITENSESAHSFVYKDAGGNQTGAAGVAGQGASGQAGRWTAKGSQLTLVFQNGEQQTLSFDIRPNSAGWPILYTRGPSDKNAREWSRVK